MSNHCLFPIPLLFSRLYNHYFTFCLHLLKSNSFLLHLDPTEYLSKLSLPYLNSWLELLVLQQTIASLDSLFQSLHSFNIESPTSVTLWTGLLGCLSIHLFSNRTKQVGTRWKSQNELAGILWITMELHDHEWSRKNEK